MEKSKDQDLGAPQTLTEHLAELRTNLIRIVIILLIGFSISYYFSESIFDFLRKPIAPYLPNGGLNYIGVTDKFLAYLKVSFLAGTILTCPLWLFQLWSFIAPGLYKAEKRMAMGFVFFGLVFFVLGVLFAYKFVLPVAFKFLLTFGGTTDLPFITIDRYLDFITSFFLAFGGAFETPVILTFLGIMGIVDAEMLRANRRWAILIMSVVSAVVTPPDVLSMLSLLIPLIGLYELSIVSVYFFQKKEKLLSTT